MHSGGYSEAQASGFRMRQVGPPGAVSKDIQEQRIRVACIEHDPVAPWNTRVSVAVAVFNVSLRNETRKLTIIQATIVV